GLDGGQGRADPTDHVQGGTPLGLEDRHEDRPPSVATDDVGLHGEPVGDVGDVLDVDGDAVDRLDRDVVEGGDQVGAAVEPDVVLRVADLGRSRRDDQVLVADGRGDVVGRHAAGVHGVRVEVDHDLALLAAPGLGHPRPLDGA